VTFAPVQEMQYRSPAGDPYPSVQGKVEKGRITPETEAIIRLAADLKEQMAQIREEMTVMQRQIAEQKQEPQQQKSDVKVECPVVTNDDPVEFIPYPDLSHIVLDSVEYPDIPEVMNVCDMPPVLGRTEEKVEEVKVDDSVFYPPRETFEEDRAAYYAPPVRRAIPMV
jgi:hypothetical protein